MANRERGSWRAARRLLLIAFAALAFILQSYAVQTHFHELSGNATASIQAEQPSGKHHQPLSNDADSCLLCHSLYSGHYVAPSLATWFLLIVAGAVIAATTGVSPHYDTVSHSWRGRGPPHN